MIQSGSGKDLRASPPCPPPEPLCPSFPSEHRFHAWYRKSPEILHFRAFLSVFDLRSALAELSGGSENMPGPCFPERPQRLCREDAAVRQEIYLLENCRAEQKTCRGHVFPRDRSGYAARMPQCDKRFISWRTEAHDGRPSDRTSESFRLQNPLFIKVFKGYAIGLSLRLSP